MATFIIYENGMEIESCRVDPATIFPKEYADRFRPLVIDDSIIKSAAPGDGEQNWVCTYEDLGTSVKKTLSFSPLTEDQTRGRRNSLLKSTDHTQVEDFPKKDRWKTYRQKLRDLPTDPKFPNLKDADWPQVDLSD